MGQHGGDRVQQLPPHTRSTIVEKKAHTVTKHRILAVAARLVRSRSQTGAGRLHDKRLGEADDSSLPPGGVLWKETGCQGFAPDTRWIDPPQKKPRGHARRPADQAEHTRMARMRLLVAHAMAGVQRCRMGPEIWRNTPTHCDALAMEMAGGFHNFRTTLRYNALE